MEDIEMEEDRDSIKCGNESSHGAMQLGERHRDASNREHSPILYFDKERETPEAGFEFFAPLRSFREGTTQGEQPRPEPFKQMVLLSDQEEYDDYDSVQSQQSLSSVKVPGDFPTSKAEITTVLENSQNMVHFIKISDGGFCCIDICFSEAKFNMEFLNGSEYLWKVLTPHKEELEGITSLNQNTKAACQRLFDLSLRKQEIRTRLDREWNTETQFNWVVATEILQPLSGGVCIINKKPDGLSPGNDHYKNVVTPTEINERGLAIGYDGGYHGEPDMLVCPPDKTDEGLVVAVDKGTGPSIQQSEEGTENPRNEKKTQGTSPPRRPNSPGKCVVEGKYRRPKGKLNLKVLSQSVATIVAFANIQYERHGDWRTSYPMLWIGKEEVIVLFYDISYDILMISDPISWGSCEALAVIWSAVNYSILPTLDFSRFEVNKCGLKAEIKKYRKNFKKTYYLESSAVFQGRSKNNLPRGKSP